jgi:polyferredoxin
VLAWPLFLWNVFTHQPMGAWLVLSAVQTLVIIPWIVLRWGKGAYCGWICSCGALAETMGDAHRHKMPHGPVWNRLNLAGQGILALATALLLLRVAAWAFPGNRLAQDAYAILLTGRTAGGAALPFPVTLLNYRWLVDLFLAGIVGTGFYFHFSGRVWCRFACPLAAWMHVVARFSRFRILADKKKCISCNVCTSVCHQGIDVMSFANKGLPMEDPECVRCSACVQSCPTGVLSFGGVDPRTGAVIGTDRLAASALALRDAAVRGAPVR